MTFYPLILRYRGRRQKPPSGPFTKSGLCILPEFGKPDFDKIKKVIAATWFEKRAPKETIPVKGFEVRGGVTNPAIAQLYLDAGAQFLTCDGLEPDVIDFASKQEVVVIPGALTPTPHR